MSQLSPNGHVENSFANFLAETNKFESLRRFLLFRNLAKIIY